jgi:hypothetical protein
MAAGRRQRILCSLLGSGLVWLGLGALLRIGLSNSEQLAALWQSHTSR